MKPADVRNLYERLGIAKDASPDDIRKAFRSLAVEWHPDSSTKLAREKDKGLQYRAVQKAYDILSDPNKRTQYNAYLERRAQPTANDPFRYYSRADEDFREILRRAQERQARYDQERQERQARWGAEAAEREARWKEIEKQREREMKERVDRLDRERQEREARWKREREEREARWKDTKKENFYYKNPESSDYIIKEVDYTLRPDYKTLEEIIRELNNLNNIRKKK